MGRQKGGMAEQMTQQKNGMTETMAQQTNGMAEQWDSKNKRHG